MNSKGKYIGLNQRIPFEVLDSAIQYYLTNGPVPKDFILERMKEHTSGENRARKAASYAAQILSRQEPILLKIQKVNIGQSYNSIKIHDRKALCLCLICLTYPITYDLLIALSQGFKVQSQINKKFISEKVMSIYGSNRTVDIAIDALLPMIIELNTIQRDKLSLYSKASGLQISQPFLTELVVYTDIKLSGSKSILTEDINSRPWYAYFDFLPLDTSKFKSLIQRKESSIGKGYLSITN
jgi:hypothetical protein